MALFICKLSDVGHYFKDRALDGLSLGGSKDGSLSRGTE